MLSGTNAWKTTGELWLLVIKKKYLAWKEHYARVVNEEFEQYKTNVSVDKRSIGLQAQIDKESVKKALNQMKKNKASDTSGVVLEMLLASGDLGTAQMANLFHQIIADNKVPEGGNISGIMNCFKKKHEATEQVNYGGLKLREHIMKVFERVIEQKIREMLHIDAMQFDFIPRKDTMDATFIARQLQEKNLEKKKEKLYLAFVDMEIAFDCVHREVVKSAMRKLVVDE